MVEAGRHQKESRERLVGGDLNSNNPFAIARIGRVVPRSENALIEDDAISVQRRPGAALKSGAIV